MHYRYFLIPLIALIAGCAQSDRDYVRDYDDDDRSYDGRIAYYDRDCDRYYDRQTGNYDRDCDRYYDRRIREIAARQELAANAQYRAQAQEFRAMAERRRVEADLLARDFGPTYGAVIQKRREAEDLMARADEADRRAFESRPEVPRDSLSY